jgi:hypothetical protein
MTQDYTSAVLDYLTGNMVEQTESNVPIFNQQVDTLNENIATNIESILLNDEDAQSVVILGKIYNESYGAYLIYGYYLDNSSNYYGFIYLVDDELNEIQMITEFASGTKLFPITALNQDENNNIYGLSNTVGTDPGTTRVLLLNNIFASGLLDGNYRCILRNDYISPYSYYQTPYRQNRIIKSPEGSTYYMIYTGSTSTKIVKFTINVGSTNDWESYSIPHKVDARFDVLLDKSTEEERLLFYGTDTSSPSVYYEYELKNQTLTELNSITLEGLASLTYSQTFVKDINNIFIYACYAGKDRGTLYKIDGNNLITIYDFPFYTDGGGTYLSYISLFSINNGTFFFEKYRTGTTCDVYVGFIDSSNNYIRYQVGTTDNTPWYSGFYDYVDLYYKTTYNLINLYVPIYSTVDTTTKLTFDYNSINFNGIPYKNQYMLVPTKGRLYDENDKLIFARNLYNKTINGNTTVSTINVPNTNLNSITIATQDLIGKTNYTLVTNEEDITKNIYENLNINFNTTLRMINKNDPSNPIFNQLGSNRINSSVSGTNNYEDTKATKIQINYETGTPLIQSIQPEQITYSNGVYTYTFMVYVPKTISNIQILSNDELTVYQTITGTFEIGKYYLITQDVRIGG